MCPLSGNYVYVIHQPGDPYLEKLCLRSWLLKTGFVCLFVCFSAKRQQASNSCVDSAHTNLSPEIFVCRYQ